jgi:hypothetical protein
MKVPAPAGLSATEWAFCTEGNSAYRGPEIVDEAGRTYLGWEGHDWDRDGVGANDIAGQPGVGTACRIAYELYALDQAQWDWCFEDTNRAALLSPAVALLGMGEDEAADSETFREAPGDDPVEYTQACRLAYHYWRDQGGVSAIADPRSHPFFAVTREQQAWCGAVENRSVLEWTALQLGIETAADAPFIEQLTAYVRSCRIASIAGRVPAADAPIVHVRDALHLFSPEVRAGSEARLAEIERSTGFVGVFITEPTPIGGNLGNDMPTGPEVDGYLELRYSEGIGGCCATVYAPREPEPGVCCPFVDDLASFFTGGRTDEGLRAFVTLVEEFAGEPEPPPRRLPADPFQDP